MQSLFGISSLSPPTTFWDEKALIRMENLALSGHRVRAFHNVVSALLHTFSPELIMVYNIGGGESFVAFYSYSAVW